MDVTLPDLGENIEEAEVLKVLVREGETIERDQPVLELETDKATFELPCPEAGTVTAIHVKKGDTLRIGQRLITLEAGRPAAAGRGGRGAATGAPEPAPARAERPAGERASRKLERPADEDPGESRQTAARARPRERERPADEDARESPAAEARPAARAGGRGPTEDADASGEAPAAPSAERRRAETRDTEDEGDSAEAESTPAPARTRRAETRPAPPRAPGARPGEREEDGGAEPVAAGPMARRLAREHDVDLRRIRGTGSGGRITPEDVQAFVRDQASAGRAPAAPAAERGADEAADSAERQPLSGIDKAAARHLAASWSEIPHVTHHDLADVTELEQARARHASRQAESGPKLTWTALVVKAVVAALGTFPRFNATFDAERAELVLNRAIHLGIAVDTERGLLVPVLRDAEGKSTRQIAAEIAALAERARARKLGREEMRGAGFTVTNLGGIGGVAFTPIVSRPEVAILGVARLHERLALRDGQPVARIMLPLSLSYDHRVINGADAARFVRHVAGLLEDPVALLLES